MLRDIYNNYSDEKKEYLRQNCIRARKIQQWYFDSMSEEDKEKRKKRLWEQARNWWGRLSDEERKNTIKKAADALRANWEKRIKEKWYNWWFQKPWVFEKAIEAYRNNAEKRKKETWYARPCQYPQVRIAWMKWVERWRKENPELAKEIAIKSIWNARKYYTKESKVNKKRNDFLKWCWYDVEKEFCLWWYWYDLKIWNTLIEINPRPFHNMTILPKKEHKLDKLYHYNKLKFAIDNWYNCIMVWDWNTQNEIVDIIKQNKEVKQKEPILHWYNKTTKEHIIDNWFNKQDMIQKWYVEIWDWWEIYL